MGANHFFDDMVENRCGRKFKREIEDLKAELANSINKHDANILLAYHTRYNFVYNQCKDTKEIVDDLCMVDDNSMDTQHYYEGQQHILNSILGFMIPPCEDEYFQNLARHIKSD